MLDISPLGAGLELFSVVPDEHLEGTVVVSFEIRGLTRNVVRDEEQNAARLGVEFPAVTEATKEYLRGMNGSKSRW